MKKFINTLFLLSVIVLFVTSCNMQHVVKSNPVDDISIIPRPVSIIRNSGFFFLKSKTPFYVSSDKAGTVAKYFGSKLAISTGCEFPVINKKNTNTDKQYGIYLTIDSLPNINHEAYLLIVNKSSIIIKAETAKGVFYGMQSLMQLLPTEAESLKTVGSVAWKVPCLIINDVPRFPYRGIMFDVCRHFMPVDFIKKQIDVLSMFKINYLHLHLTDDQAWRLEIKKYPKLTEIGAACADSSGNAGHCYYTQDEMRDIVAYAAEHQMTVIPEIEVPGHELAAIAAYPQLSCKGDTVAPRKIWGVEKVVMCPGKEDMFTFINEVIAEMVTIFPSPYYHIGGDECPIDSWKKCPDCQQRIKNIHLKANNKFTAEQQLEGYVIKRVETILSKYKKKAIGWDEILVDSLQPSTVIMSWHGESVAIIAAHSGHDVIMAPEDSGMYLNYYQGDYKIEPIAESGYSTLAETYRYNPTSKELVMEDKDHFIKGVQCDLWTEYAATPLIMEYRMYPRALAVAETGWTPEGEKNFKDFTRRLDKAEIRLDSLHINYHIPLPEQPYGSCNQVAFVHSTKLLFKTTRPVRMVYTTNGKDPTPDSRTYKRPLMIRKSMLFKIASVLPSRKMSVIRSIRLEKENYSKAYNFTDASLGVALKVMKDDSLNSRKLPVSKKWESTSAGDFLGLHKSEQTDENAYRHYAAVADGYFSVEKDGVYYFSSENSEVWIDGWLLINNNNEIKEYSHHDGSMALARGYHQIKVVYISNITGGFPSAWSSPYVLIRKSNEKKFGVVGSGMLCHLLK